MARCGLRRSASRLGLVLGWFGLTCAASLAADAPKPEDVVIRLGDERVLGLPELTAALGYQPANILEALKHEPNAARVFAVRWFQEMLLAEAARQDGELAKQPGLEEAADQLARRLIAERVVMGLEKANEPTEQEIEQYYKLNDTLCRVESRYRIARIGVLVGRHATPKEVEAARERITAIEGRLANGEDFAAVVATASDMPEKQPGGELGWVSEKDLGSDVGGAALRGLKPGGRTAILQTPRGLEIFKLLEKEEARTLPLAECRDKIAEALRTDFKRSLLERRADELAERLGGTLNLDAFLSAIAAAKPIWAPAP